MVRRKPTTSTEGKNDLSKLKFKPGKYLTVSTTKIIAIKEANKEMEINNPPQTNIGTSFETSVNEEQSSKDVPCTTNVNTTSLKSALLINVPVQNKYAALEIPDDIMAQQIINHPLEAPEDNAKSLRSALLENSMKQSQAALENENIMETQPIITEETNKTANGSGKKTQAQESKPPAIVLHSKIGSHSAFFTLLDSYLQAGYYVKNTKNCTNIFVKNTEEFKKCRQILEDENISYHTYTLKEEKPHSFVLKGIDSNPTVDEIKYDLENRHNINIKNIFKLKNTKRGIYVIQTDNSIHLKYLSNNIRYVCHTKITWERFNKQDPWVQCRRCQKLGHSTSNCHANPACVKCGADHWSRECTKVKKEDAETHVYIKCANCNGKHLAFSKECPVIQRRKQMVERIQNNRDERNNTMNSRISNKVNYVMAPSPRENAWTSRPTTNQRNYTEDNSATDRTGDSAVQNNITDLMGEFNVLNELLDINKMLNLVRELNELLKGSKSEMEKFVIFNNFCLKKFRSTNCVPSNLP